MFKQAYIMHYDYGVQLQQLESNYWH